MQLLYMLEVETAMAGRLYNVNTFDQPGVEAGKIIAINDGITSISIRTLSRVYATSKLVAAGIHQSTSVRTISTLALPPHPGG